MKLTYPACFYPCIGNNCGYTVEVPDLPGGVSEGKTLADAIFMATDAACGWVLDELEDRQPVHLKISFQTRAVLPQCSFLIWIPILKSTATGQ